MRNKPGNDFKEFVRFFYTLIFPSSRRWCFSSSMNSLLIEHTVCYAYPASFKCTLHIIIIIVFISLLSLPSLPLFPFTSSSYYHASFFLFLYVIFTPFLFLTAESLLRQREYLIHRARILAKKCVLSSIANGYAFSSFLYFTRETTHPSLLPSFSSLTPSTPAPPNVLLSSGESLVALHPSAVPPTFFSCLPRSSLSISFLAHLQRLEKYFLALCRTSPCFFVVESHLQLLQERRSTLQSRDVLRLYQELLLAQQILHETFRKLLSENINTSSECSPEFKRRLAQSDSLDTYIGLLQDQSPSYALLLEALQKKEIVSVSDFTVSRVPKTKYNLCFLRQITFQKFQVELQSRTTKMTREMGKKTLAMAAEFVENVLGGLVPLNPSLVVKVNQPNNSTEMQKDDSVDRNT